MPAVNSQLELFLDVSLFFFFLLKYINDNLSHRQPLKALMTFCAQFNEVTKLTNGRDSLMAFLTFSTKS
jgi:hypothetical protein